MAGRKSKLTPELIETVCSSIRNGSYDYVAAQAAGVHSSTFYEWLSEGEKPDCSDPLKREFSEKVAQARADARKVAESAVFGKDPATWLLKGPGKRRPETGLDGWANDSSVTIAADDKTKIAFGWADGAEQNEDS